jgi:iron complex transport system substrate-binding protein
MFAGNWTPRLIELAGGESQLADANSPSEYSTLEDLLACDPDVIIVAPCGFGLERSLAETETLRKHPRWHELQAVRNRRVYVIDGNQYLNRSGPRLVDTVEILAKIIQDLPTENAIRLK